jgi:hypothetical protein
MANSKQTVLLVGTLLVWFGGVTAASAQPAFLPGGVLPQNAPPVVSPYINLLRNGNNGNRTDLNYYGLVNPQVNYGTSIGSLQQQVGSNSQIITDLNTQLATPITGHRSSFMNNNRYFLTHNYQSGFGGGAYGGGGGYGGGAGGAGYGNNSAIGGTSNPQLRPGSGLGVPSGSGGGRTR